MKTTLQDKIRGSLIGGAIGDALGYPVEFMSYAGIVHKYGERGITRYEPDRKSGKALISDDTQMTMFTANGLLFGVTQWCTHGRLADLPPFVEYSYLEWYETQTGVRDYNAYHTCWIRDIKELNARRAPGNTCMSAMESIMNGKEVVNDSKGCGGVMRVAPIGCLMAAITQMRCYGWAKNTVDGYAAECAAITHKHPLGYIPAAVLANVVYRIVIANETISKGKLFLILEHAMMDAQEFFTKDNEVKAWAELSTLMNNAIQLAQAGVKDVDAIRQLGEGWTGDEALAIAVYCALKHTYSFEDAVIAAVNHSGDSDSTGAVCGNIMGAIVGYEAIPEYFKEDLELRPVILALADDMIYGYPECDNDRKKWEQRYVFAKPMHNSYAVNDWLYAGEYPGGMDERKAKEKLDESIKDSLDYLQFKSIRVQFYREDMLVLQLLPLEEQVEYKSMLKAEGRYIYEDKSKTNAEPIPKIRLFDEDKIKGSRFKGTELISFVKNIVKEKRYILVSQFDDCMAPQFPMGGIYHGVNPETYVDCKLWHKDFGGICVTLLLDDFIKHCMPDGGYIYLLPEETKYIGIHTLENISSGFEVVNTGPSPRGDFVRIAVSPQRIKSELIVPDNPWIGFSRGAESTFFSEQYGNGEHKVPTSKYGNQYILNFAVSGEFVLSVYYQPKGEDVYYLMGKGFYCK